MEFTGVMECMYKVNNKDSIDFRFYKKCYEWNLFGEDVIRKPLTRDDLDFFVNTRCA